MLRVVDGTAAPILRAIDLSAFLRSQLAAVRLPISRDLLINPLLPVFEARGLAGFQTAAANSLCNPVLLKLAARPHFIVAVMCHVGIVLIAIDFIAEMVLLAIHLLPLLLRQRSPIGCPVIVDLPVQVGFLTFERLRLAGRQCSRLYAIRDAIL